MSKTNKKTKKIVIKLSQDDIRSVRKTFGKFLSNREKMKQFSPNREGK